MRLKILGTLIRIVGRTSLSSSINFSTAELIPIEAPIESSVCSSHVNPNE